ncbi:hypothetical protein IGI04_008172 [Brassica rapa subsp. trilocularis]|uniref:Translation elongation factor EFTu-like domain-containing protein n=1 Tax=Brassica rapa subsp. trilocularis TaxID=1813537 RepID=A0ABQ7NM65_BRACM|nr:hypothetical protein IGI04_008172 [Brassica rapa subsp. trilocularis]
MEALYGFDPMKTVRPEEFATPYSATSIISIANIDDNQTRCSLSILLEFTGTRIHASVGEQLIKKFDDKLREGDAIVLQLFKVYDATASVTTLMEVVSAHLKIKPSLPQIEDPKTVNDIEPYTVKIHSFFKWMKYVGDKIMGGRKKEESEESMKLTVEQKEIKEGILKWETVIARITITMV